MALNPTATDPKALARERRAAKQRRTNRIRTRVAVGTVTVFVAFFSTIYAQMASGHDPVLSSMTRSATTTATGATSSSSGASTSSTDTTSSGSTSTGSSGATATQSTPSAVTTQQS
jgi:hypothetical protein